MSKQREAFDKLIEGIEYYVQKVVENASFDKTLVGYITEVNANSTYDLIINGRTYTNIKTINGICTQNEVVKVLIPMNDYNNMIILK